MASRRCPGVGGTICPYYLATWDLHDTCKSHRVCAIETRCSICADWGDKEWNHIPLLVKKVISKRKKTTRASCKSLSSPQSPTLTSADLQQSVGVFQGPLSLESGVGETTGYSFPRLTVDPYPRAQGREIQRGIMSQSYPLERVARTPPRISHSPLFGFADCRSIGM